MESTYSVLAGGVSAWGLGRMGARGGFGSGGALGTGSNRGILLSASTFTAGAAQNTAIGTLSVVGATGTPTFTLTDSHTNAVQVAGANGASLQVGSASSSAGSFSITVHVTGVTPSIADTVFLITATGGVALKADLSNANANEAWVFW